MSLPSQSGPFQCIQLQLECEALFTHTVLPYEERGEYYV